LTIPNRAPAKDRCGYGKTPPETISTNGPAEQIGGKKKDRVLSPGGIYPKGGKAEKRGKGRNAEKISERG